jgi:hypothetical protein
VTPERGQFFQHLALGLLKLRGVNGLAGWRWLLAIEGTITGLIGVATYFYLPPSPTQTSSFFRGKRGWFNEHEEKIMVNRILRDDPSKGAALFSCTCVSDPKLNTVIGDMHNRQAVTPKVLWQSLLDWEMWPVFLIGLSFLIPNYPATAYLTLNLKSLGFSTFHTNLLTIPAYVLFIGNLLFWTWVSERTNQRFLTGLISQIWSLPLLVTLEVLPVGTSQWVKWALSVLLVRAPYAHAINVAITSRNAGSVRTRTVASALYQRSQQAGRPACVWPGS